MALLHTYTSLFKGIGKTELHTPYAPCLHKCNILSEFKQVNKKQNCLLCWEHVMTSKDTHTSTKVHCSVEETNRET